MKQISFLNRNNYYRIFFILILITISVQQSIKSKIVNRLNKLTFSSFQQKKSQNNLQQINPQFLDGQQYEGQYQSLQNQNLFNYLDTKKGNIQVLFFNQPSKQSTTNLNSFGIQLFNPKYHDLKAILIQIDLQKMTQQGLWQQENTKIFVTKFYKGRMVNSDQNDQVVNNVSYRIKANNFNSQQPSDIRLSIEMKGPNFDFKANLDYDHDSLSTLGYCLYITLVVGGQIYCAINLLQRIDQDNPALITKMSLLTLSICNIQDFYFTMINIEYIMYTGTAYLLYIFPAIAYLILFVIFDMKMLFLVWRSHHIREIQNAQALRKKLTAFYIQFYLGLFIYLTLNYFFQYESWLIFIQHLLILPQIVHNVRMGNNPGFAPHYVLGFLGLRFFVPLYQRSCPQNHFQLEPMPILVGLLALFYGIQIAILYFQSKYGPRFFIPRFLLPNYFNYNIKLKLTEQNKGIDCSICLLNIFSPQPNSIMSHDSLQNQQNLLSDINIMKTPCNHYFHKQCLTTWLDVKLQCPSCRQTLPAI